ncbi:MAG TPA: ester cyclase [Gemmatimonadota bacterium]|nr:ester cyclase [Gemmatimonadota bacterium]
MGTVEMKPDQVRELLRREALPGEYERIRALWKAHSIAEDGRDIAGLLATLTPDCVYEVVTTGHRWEGHSGARDFYAGLLGAFPDVRFELTNIVIGPQGVCEEALLTATHAGEWLGLPATGRYVDFGVVIFFPWDRERGLFAGERIHFDPVRAGLTA